MVYFLLPITSLFLLMCKRRTILIFVFVFLFGVFSGGRGPNVDPDYINYYNLWYKSYTINDLYIEPISKLIFKIAYDLNLNFNLSLITFSILTLYLLYRSCENLKANIPIFFISYSGYFFLVQNMMQVRFGLGLALFLFGLTKIESDSRTAILFVILSVLCHQSLILLAFFMITYKFSKSNLFFVIFFLAIIFQLISLLKIDFLSPLFDVINSVSNNRKVDFYYNVYLSSNESTNVFNLLHLINLSLMCVCVFCVVKLINPNRAIYFMINAMSFGVILFITFYKLPSFSFRFSE